MLENQDLETTPLSQKKSGQKDILQQGFGVEGDQKEQQPEVSPLKFPQGTKTVEATTFELNLTLSVKMGQQEIVPPKDNIVTLERVIDTENQLFKSGVATVVLMVDSHSIPVERVEGIDAEDVRLILRLFGLAK